MYTDDFDMAVKRAREYATLVCGEGNFTESIQHTRISAAFFRQENSTGFAVASVTTIILDLFYQFDAFMHAAAREKHGLHVEDR